MATGTPISDAPTDATTNIANLLPRVGNGDATAWEEIFRRYGTLSVAMEKSPLVARSRSALVAS
jgi:hypothetical protein